MVRLNMTVQIKHDLTANLRAPIFRSKPGGFPPTLSVTPQPQAAARQNTSSLLQLASRVPCFAAMEFMAECRGV